MTFAINAPSSITWNWKIQYQVTFDQTGVGSDFTGTVVTIDSVNYNNLSSAAVTELAALARRRGMEVLQEINARALRLQQQDSGQPGASHRFNCGVYVFSEDQAERSVEDTDEPQQ